MSKVYILQKDLPDLKAGAKFQTKEGMWYRQLDDKLNYYCFPASLIRTNQEWFKEEKLFQVWFTSIGQYDSPPSYIIRTSEKIPEKKYDAIKKALESVLNDDCYFDAPRLNQRLDELKFAAPKKYTEEDMRLCFKMSRHQDLSACGLVLHFTNYEDMKQQVFDKKYWHDL